MVQAAGEQRFSSDALIKSARARRVPSACMCFTSSRENIHDHTPFERMCNLGVGTIDQILTVINLH